MLRGYFVIGFAFLKMPRKYLPKRGPPNYSLDDLAKAVADVQAQRRTYREAAAYYSIPHCVIYNRIKGRKIPIDRMGAGVSTALPARIENHIVTCLKARAKVGYPCDKQELLNVVGEYVKENQLKTRFRDGIPGEDWYRAFMKRHPSLSLKKPELLQKLRKDARKPEIIFDFYSKLKEVIQNNGLDINKSMFVFNADESGFNSDPSRVRAIGSKGQALSRVSGGSGRESTTVLACVSADGKYLPPLIIFKGSAVQARWVLSAAMPGTLYATSKNGWMEEPQFYHWFLNGFVPHVQTIREIHNLPDQKAVLLYDGHRSHISIRIIEQALEHNIDLIKFPSHLTDKLQPLDRCVFKPVKYTWDRKLVAYGKKRMGKGTGRLPKDKFVELLSETWQEAMISKNIISGFESTGVYPVNSLKFPESEFNLEQLHFYKEKIHSSQTPTGNNLDGDQENASKGINESSINEPGPSNEVRLSNEAEPSNEAGPSNKAGPSNEAGLSSSKTRVNQSSVAKSATSTAVENMSNFISPAKEALDRIFSVETERIKKNLGTDIVEDVAPTEKRVIPRLKQLAYGEVLTSKEVLNRMKEQQELRTQKGKGKVNKIPKKADSVKTPTSIRSDFKINTISENPEKTSKKRRKSSSSSSNASETEISYAESNDSPWDEQVEEEPQELEAWKATSSSRGNLCWWSLRVVNGWRHRIDISVLSKISIRMRMT